MDRYALGVDIGGTRTKLGLVNISAGEVIKMILIPTEKENETVFLEHIVNAAEEFAAMPYTSSSRLEGIGFGVPAFVDGGRLVDSTYGFLPFMDGGYPLQSRITERLGLPCLLDNDARVVGLGEAMYGAGKGYGRVLTLTLGTGLGVGFVVAGGFPDALPLGHMSGHISIRPDGPLCYCGKRGCLEALVSSAALQEAVAIDWPAGEPPPGSMEQLFGLAKDGHPLASKRVELLLEALHTGIHNYANILAPDIVVLGGGISRGLAGYEERLRKANYLQPHTAYRLEVVLSALQEHAGILGAAALFCLKQNK